MPQACVNCKYYSGEHYWDSRLKMEYFLCKRKEPPVRIYMSPHAHSCTYYEPRTKTIAEEIHEKLDRVEAIIKDIRSVVTEEKLTELEQKLAKLEKEIKELKEGIR